jgi:hypothetical protein
MEKKTSKKKESVKPVMTFKDYPVSVSIWKKNIKVEKKNITVYNSTVVSTYKDDDDEYQTTSNFKEQELLKVSLLTQKAYNWILNAKQKDYDESKKDKEEEEETEEEEEE